MSKELRKKLIELEQEILAVKTQLTAEMPSPVEILRYPLEPLTLEFNTTVDYPKGLLEICGGDGVVVVEPEHFKQLIDYVTNCLEYTDNNF